jgi:hypothetical protein
MRSPSHVAALGGGGAQSGLRHRAGWMSVQGARVDWESCDELRIPVQLGCNHRPSTAPTNPRSNWDTLPVCGS